MQEVWPENSILYITLWVFQNISFACQNLSLCLNFMDFMNICQQHMLMKENLPGVLGKRNMACNRTGSPAATMALQAGLIKISWETVSCPGKCDMRGRCSHQSNYIFIEYKIQPSVKLYFYRMLFHVANRHIGQVKLPQIDMKINVTLNHATENAPTRVTNGHRTTHFSGFIPHNNFGQ